MDGVLVIDKPAGPTSHAVVARLRRSSRLQKIGHTGTLDPLATGVLPLVVGKATRLAQFFSGGDKVYEAEIRFGHSTDTHDRAGEFIQGSEGAPGVVPAGTTLARADIESALDAFRGTFLQTPPQFSAKKVDGVRAYTLARKAVPVELQPVTVTVHALEILSFQAGVLHTQDADKAPRVSVRLAVSAGFYVRALAHALGVALGCGAWLESLRRTRSGGFTLADAVPLDTAEEEGAGVLRRLIRLDRLLPEIPGIGLKDEAVQRMKHGRDVASDDFLTAAPAPAMAWPAGTKVRLLDLSGALVGIGEPTPSGEALHPIIVLV